MAVVEELIATFALPIRMYRQLRLADVRTPEELYAFLTAFPTLADGTGVGPAPSPNAARLVERYASPRRLWPSNGTVVARIPTPAEEGDRLMEQMMGADRLPERDARYHAILAWCRARCDPRFVAATAALNGTARRVATGAKIPPGGPTGGRSIPLSVLSAPLRHVVTLSGRVVIDYEEKYPPHRPFLDEDTHRGAPPPAAIPLGSGGATDWYPAPLSISPLGEAAEVVQPGASSWPARDQGLRGTCCAHAALASVEDFDRVTTGAFKNLSEQFLFGAATRSLADDATTLKAVGVALGDAGVCLEDAAPYLLQNTLPAEPNLSAARGRRYTSGYVPWGQASEVYKGLRDQRAVAMSLPVFADPVHTDSNNWNTSVGFLYGRVLGAPAGAIAWQSAHAVCAVSYQLPHEAGGWFIFRNSWGNTRWGTSRAEGAPTKGWRKGYGHVAAAYVAQMLLEHLVITARSA